MVLRPVLTLVPLLPLRVTPRLARKLVPLLARRIKMLPATGRCLTLLRPTKLLSPAPPSPVNPASLAGLASPTNLVSLPRRRRDTDKYPRATVSRCRVTARSPRVTGRHSRRSIRRTTPSRCSPRRLLKYLKATARCSLVRVHSLVSRFTGMDSQFSRVSPLRLTASKPPSR